MVTSSAKLQTSVSLMKNIKSLIKMLNRIGSKIEPCGRVDSRMPCLGPKELFL